MTEGRRRKIKEWWRLEKNGREVEGNNLFSFKHFG